MKRFHYKSSGNVAKLAAVPIQAEFGHLKRVIGKYSNMNDINVKELYKELATNELAAPSE